MEEVRRLRQKSDHDGVLWPLFCTFSGAKTSQTHRFSTVLAVSPSGPVVAGGLLGVCWSCLLRFSFLFSHAVKQNSSFATQAARWKEDEWRGEQRPRHRGPRPATFTHVISSNNERGTAERGQRAPNTPTGLPRGEGLSPTSSLRCEFAASVIFTQIRIYRVNVDDGWSERGCTGDASCSLLHF